MDAKGVAMAGRIADVSRQGAAERLVGRDECLTALDELLVTGPAPSALVAFVHGIAGIGKSALLTAFAVHAERGGARVIALDCRTIEPTERGFLRELATRLELAEPRLEEVLDALAREPALTVITLDNYEVFRLLDTWLRQQFVPALPQGVRVVCCGREAPLTAWLTTSEIHGVVRIVPLGPLPELHAVRLLAELGVEPASAQRLNRLVRGHPLALQLAAATFRADPALELEGVAAHGALDALARIFLADVEHLPTRRALEAASVLRRVTRPLIAAMLADAGAEAFDGLAALPLVEARADGLVIHDAVREPIAAALRSTDPDRYRTYRRAAWRELRHEVRDASPSDLWRYTADMLFLIENPVVREAFFPSAMQPFAVEAARSADAAAIQAIARRHEGLEGQRLLAAWWSAAPRTFSVMRDRDGEVISFFVLLDNATMLPPAVRDDPVVRQWVEHPGGDRVRRGERVLGLRRWLDAEHGERPCDSQAACWLDVKRTYMALRPNLRRIYVTVQDAAAYWPTVEKLGFRPAAQATADLAGEQYASVFLDFGPGSVDGWLAGLVGAELGLDARLQLDETAREVVIDNRRTTLTPLEFGVLGVLHRADGRTVARDELLQAVWGTTFSGGSNVVDAVIHGLRNRLGADHRAVETVRGAGYRLRVNWTAGV